MTGTKERDQILLPNTEIGGSISIPNTLRTDTVNLLEPTIQPTIVLIKQATGPGHSDRNHFPIRILNSAIDVPRYRQNIYNRTGMKPKGPILTTIPEYNRANKFDIFDSVIRMLDLAYRGSPWHGTMKSESEI